MLITRLLGGGVAALAGLLALIATTELPVVLVLAVVTVLPVCALDAARVTFQIRQIMIVPVGLRVACQALALGALYALDRRGALDVTTALLVYASLTSLSAISCALTAFILMRVRPALGPGARRLRAFLKESWPHGLATACVTLYFSIDTLILPDDNYTCPPAATT